MVYSADYGHTVFRAVPWASDHRAGAVFRCLAAFAERLGGFFVRRFKRRRLPLAAAAAILPLPAHLSPSYIRAG